MLWIWCVHMHTKYLKFSLHTHVSESTTVRHRPDRRVWYSIVLVIRELTVVLHSYVGGFVSCRITVVRAGEGCDTETV